MRRAGSAYLGCDATRASRVATAHTSKSVQKALPLLTLWFVDVSC